VKAIHLLLIQQTGGTPGLRDPAGLESTVARPWSGFGDTEVFPLLEDKAAALLHGSAKNHAFY
jgi:death-on-curing protein